MKSNGQLPVTSYLLSNISPDSLQIGLANRLKLDSFIVSVFNYIQPTGQIAKETGANNPDARTIFLIGLKNDSIIVIGDANNNNHLDDDKIIVTDREILKSQSTKNLERLPLIQINNLQTTYNGQNYTFSKKVFLMPDTIRTGELTLTAVLNEQYKGQFKYKGKKYYVCAGQMTSGYFITEPRFVSIRIDEGRAASKMKFNKSIDIYHLYDVVKMRKNSFRIEEVDPLLNKIIVKPVFTDSLINGHHP